MKLYLEVLTRAEDGLPTISPDVARIISVAYAVAYVVPFYYSENLRISEHVSRNSPTSIKARSHAVFLTCVLCFAITVPLHSVTGPATPGEFLHRMGLYPVLFTDTLRSMLLVGILFIGPIFEQGLAEGNWRHWFRWRSFRAIIWDDWIGWRNLVVGPVSEEVLFRSLIISLFLAGWVRGSTIVFQAPLVFGVAHLHHLNEHIITHRRQGQSYFSAVATPDIIIPGLVRTLFQLGFTTLFGMFVTFIFLRTGNVYSCILIHTFCNWLGLPRLWGRVDQAVAKESAPSRSSSEDIEMDDLAATPASTSAGLPIVSSTKTTWSLGIQWTVAYYTLLITGAVGFYKLLYPLTASNNALTRV